MNVSTNHTLPCSSFASLTDLVFAANNGTVNVTLEIKQCPDLCALAWGQGNPDLSGTNISWIFQVVLTVLFGPLLPLLHHICPEPQREALADLHKEFFSASVFITIPVSIATIVYLRQVDFLFEVTFLYYLATLQFLALLGTALSTLSIPTFTVSVDLYVDFERLYSDPLGIIRSRSGQYFDFELGPDQRWRPWIERAVYVAVSCVLGFGLYLGCLRWIRHSLVPRHLLGDLTAACAAYGGIVPHIPATLVAHGRPTWRPFDILSDVVFPFGIVLVATIAVAGLVALFLVVAFLGALLAAILSPYGNAVLTTAFAAGALYCLVQMQQVRNAMRGIAGPGYVDDQWGFGQVVSIFVWIPTAVRFLVWAVQAILVKTITHDQKLRENARAEQYETYSLTRPSNNVRVLRAKPIDRSGSPNMKSAVETNQILPPWAQVSYSTSQ